MSVHDRVGAYLDGGLSPADEAAFVDHLATCAACQAALEDDVQLRDREDQLRAQVAPAAGRVTPIRGRRVALIAGGVAALAAAAAVVWLVRPKPEAAPPALALATTRALEPRLTHPDFAGYRPYDVPRGAATHERITPDAIAGFDKRGDCRGVASAYLLSGELVRASDSLARCGDAPDVLADRAGVAVMTGHPEDALDLVDRALATAPDHAVALWNRALALRDLGLGLAAADDFDRVAALDPAWAGEARQRAAALRSELLGMRDSWRHLVDVGFAMVAGGPPIEPALARRHPGRARVFFQDAVRTAKTAARLDELRPLARALDGLAGDHLERVVDDAARALTPARIALVDEYAAMVKAQAADATAFAAWSARAHAAHADDLVLAATYVTDRVGDAPERTLAAARATGDAWLAIPVLVDVAGQARRRGRTDVAAGLLDEAAAMCARGAPAYRCLGVTLEQAWVEIVRYRPAQARAAAQTALRDATAQGEWPQRHLAMFRIAEAERYRDGFAIARAYYREYGLTDGSCEAQVNVAVLDAEMLFDQHRIAAARASALARPVCPGTASFIEAALAVDLLRAEAPIRDRAATIALVDASQAALAADDPLRVMFDYLRARAELGVAPDASARLRAIVRAARVHPGDTFAARAASAAETAAIIDAGSRQAWGEAVAIAAEARQVAPPRTCALIVATDDFQQVGVAIGADGAIVGQFDRDVVPPTDGLAPARLREALRGCAQVDVIAEPPWLGVAPLLDPGMAWRFVMGPPRAAAPGPARRVVIADPRPPANLGLPALAAWTGTRDASTEVITGASATLEQLASAARDATILEIHAHAERVDDSDAPALALSEGPAGWALTAERARTLTLGRAPVVVLADCVGAVPARYAHTGWGLPAAFLEAGARGVVGALAPIPDADATAFFAEVITEVQRGTPLAVAVARARAARVAADPSSWARHVVVFE
ncbi:MAG: CHAT domain-containing protein [Deltaproteobacteria bacterium]|nr:CHAT domain-containing protein [Deltaproteobacteria bacterium]